MRPHTDSRTRFRTTSRHAMAGLVVLAAAASIATAAEDKATYQDHVRPIFESACNNCHNPDKKKGDLDLTSYAALMAGGSSGEIAVAGDPDGSRLYACITKAAEPFMPPKGDGLTAPQLDVIKRWIEGGLLDTPGGVARKAKKPAFSAQLADVPSGKPDGPPPMPENPLLEPVVTTLRASATAALAASPWAPLVALSGQHQVLLYHTDTLELAGVLPCPDGAIESLCFSRNGKLVVAGTGVGGKSGKVVAWDVTSGQRAFEVGDERDTVLAADLSADQSVVALGGPARRVKLYRTSDGELLKDLKKHTDWVTALQFSPDGVLLATGDRAGGLQVWEGRSGNEYFTLPGHTGSITAVAWRADGNLLASASEDGTIRLWEMNEGKEVKKWAAHGGGVQSMGFAPDGRLVSCGRDRHVKIWNQEGAQTAAQNQFSDLTLAACFSHDAGRFIVGDWSGRISVWSTADASAVGDMAAAPPSIDQRLAVLVPEYDKARAATEAAATAMAAVKEKENSTRTALEAARQSLVSFQEKVGSLEHSLAASRSAAEAVLARLTTSGTQGTQGTQGTPESGAFLDLTASASDLQALAESARTSVGLSRESLAQTAQAFAGNAPSRLAATRQTVAAMEAALAVAQTETAAATAAHAAAATALDQQKRAVARWEDAKISTLVFQKKGELFAVTAKLDEVTSALTTLEGQVDGPPEKLNALRQEKSALEAQAADLRLFIDSRGKG